MVRAGWPGAVGEVGLGPYLPAAAAAPPDCAGTGPVRPAPRQPLPPAATWTLGCLGGRPGTPPAPPRPLPAAPNLGHGSRSHFQGSQEARLVPGHLWDEGQRCTVTGAVCFLTSGHLPPPPSPLGWREVAGELVVSGGQGLPLSRSRAEVPCLSRARLEEETMALSSSARDTYCPTCWRARG